MTARLVAEGVRPVLGQPIAVENRPGANSIIGAQAVLTAPPDGYTYFVAGVTTFLLDKLMPTVPFNPREDFQLVSPLSFAKFAVLTRADTGATNMAEAIKLAKGSSKPLAFGSFGVATAGHFAQIELQRRSGGDVVHVPYKGASLAINALLGGEIDFTYAPLSSVQQHIANGKLVPLAVTGPSRAASLPAVPTLTELGMKGFETDTWVALWARRDVDPAIARKLGADIQTVLSGKGLADSMKSNQLQPAAVEVDQFRSSMESNLKQIRQIIEAENIKLT
ncbi:tripartite tricarboxylate transporter substrate binding protein [soil metagenome]